MAPSKDETLLKVNKKRKGKMDAYLLVPTIREILAFLNNVEVRRCDIILRSCKRSYYFRRMYIPPEWLDVSNESELLLLEKLCLTFQQLALNSCRSIKSNYMELCYDL